MISTYTTGLFSEYAAMIFLRFKGYMILERRYRNALGEIDIVVKKGNVIAFVEVKTVKEKNKFFPVVSNKQINRISRSSLLYLKRSARYNTYEIRFDLITVANLVWVKHYKNVF